MSNFVRGGAGGPRKQAIVKTPSSHQTPIEKTVAPVEKAKAPGNSKIMPIRPNTAAERGGPVGGFGDADAAARSAKVRRAPTARRGQNPPGPGTEAAHRGPGAPLMNPPTPSPGQKGKAKPHANAPRSLLQAPTGTGTTSVSGESAGRSHAQLARGGGAVGGPVRHKQPALPTPMPSFPKADNPGGSPQPDQPKRGRMAGQLQGGRGQTPGGSKLKT